MPDLASVADEIVYELQAASDLGTFNREIEPVVLWANREIKLAEANKLRVDVAPNDDEIRLFSRGRHLLVLHYDIAIRKRFEEAEQDSGGQITDLEIRDLWTLLASLCTFFLPKQPTNTGRPLTRVPEATVLGPAEDSSIPRLVRWTDLEELRQFTGYFPLTVQVVE